MKVAKCIIRIICAVLWMYLLRNTDAYYSIYLLIGAGAVLSAIFLHKKESTLDKKGNIWSFAFSIAISIMVCLANYYLYSYPYYAETTSVALKVIMFLTGVITLESISELAFDRLKCFSWKEHEYKINPVLLWAIVTVILSAIYYIVLNERMYPAVLTSDSIDQINQAIRGTYSNHHPVYHTFIIRVFLLIGSEILGMSLNRAVALFAEFQLIFMAGSFSYLIMTMSQMKVPRWIIILISCFFALLPYHFVYSVTIWKDIPFALFVMLFIVSLFRILADISKFKWTNYVVLTISGLGICLFRSNGLFAYVITVAVFAILYRLKSKKVLFFMLAILVGSIVLKYPVLKGLGISQHDTIEALSIPAQQIARVVSERNELSEEDKALINNVAEYEKIPECYTPWLSDPIKNLVRASGNMDDIKNNKMQYVKLYIKLGLQHPADYIHAWVDQTKGYWNGGYKYSITAEGVDNNGYGIYNSRGNKKIAGFIDKYCNMIYSGVVFQPFISIGLNIWLIIGSCVLCIIKKSRKVILTVPVLAVWLSIIISTPLYSEFRYIYSAFTSLPFILVAVLSKQEI